jgi:hypothetical protein
MIRNLLISLMFFISGAVFAQNATTVNPCDDIPNATKNMTSDQIRTILESCRTGGFTSQPITVDSAKEWSEIAESFAKAAGTAAKELGVATNEFLNSPAGYLLAGVLVFNYGGGLILIGIPFMILSFFGIKHAWRWAYTDKVTYENVPVLWGFWTIRRSTRTQREYLGESRGFFIAAITALIAVANIVLIVNLV